MMHKPKAKPQLDDEAQKALSKRNAANRKRPAFKRQNWFRYKRLGQKWRKPRGMHSKMRTRRKYRPPMASTSYRGPAAARGLHPSGFAEVIVHRPADLEVMDPQRGARGCQITIAGKLTGLRHRTEKFIEGHIKHCGEPALQLMQVGYSQAKLKPGTIGVKVVIMPPDAKLPDEIEVMPAVVEPIPIAKEEEATPEGEETAPADDKQASVAEAPPEEGAQPDADASKEAAKASDGGKKADAAEAPEEVTQPEAKAEDSG